MNINEILFLMQFLIVMGITAAKIYNLFKIGTLYSLRMSFILMATFFTFYFIGLVITLTDYSYSSYSILFLLESYVIPAQILFLIAELFLTQANEIKKIYTPYQREDKL